MTILFPDVSHWNAGVNLTGAQALIAKATEGVSYVDPTYAGFKAWAAGAGVPFCAYHWLDTTDAGAQARHAYAIVGPRTPLMIDDEQNVIVVGHTLQFVAAYRAAGGTVRLEYAPQWVWHDSGEPDLRPLAAAGLSIVSSNYPAAGYTDAGPGWTPYGGITPAIWQYTSRQPFGGKAVDFNAFRGTVADLRRLLDGGIVARIIQTDDSRYGKGALWGCGGAGRLRLTGDTWSVYASEWGIPAAPSKVMSEADANRIFGPDLDTLRGPAAPAPHTHATGPAIPQ